MTSKDYYQNAAKVRGLSLGHLGMMTFFLQAAIIGAVLAGITIVVSFDVASTQETLADSSARQIQNQLKRYIQHYKGVINNLAKQKTVQRYFVQNKTKSLAALAKVLTVNDPEILAIRFRQLTDLKIDKSMKPHLGYAGLDMLRAVSKGRSLPVEVHSPNTDNAHLAFGARVMDGDKVIGLIHMSVATGQLSSMTNSIALPQGVLQIQQQVDQKTINLATAGDASLLTPEPIATIEIQGTRLQIAYWSGSSFALLYSVMFLKYWGACLVIILLLGLTQMFMTKRTAAILRKDQVTLLTLFDDFVQGKLQPAYPSKLLDFRGTIEAMRKRAAETKAVMSNDPATQAHADPFSDDDLDSISDESGLDDLLLNPFPDNNEMDLGLNDSLVVDDDQQAAGVPAAVSEVSDDIFLAYDIRGIVDETLSSDVAHTLGLSIGSEAQDNNQSTLVVGYDGRLSSPLLAEALMNGIVASGCDVINIGLVPTPVVSFATHILDTQSGVMVTGSHNPPNYNGFKVTINSAPLHSDQIQGLKARIREGRLLSGTGQITQQAMIPEYINQIAEDVQLGRPLKVVLDCGNGVGAEVAPDLFRTLGVELIELHCTVDGHFPNHHPDPSQPENLQQLIETVKDKQADIGIALDGDADRIGVVDASGKIIWADRLMMLFAMDILSRQPGADVVFDVKCSRHLAKEIVKHGGRPIMWKTGHSFVRAKLRETNAVLAGEFTGHIFINERWYGFDDGIYAACRLLEMLSADFRGSDEIFAEFPDSESTPEILVPTSMGENHLIMDQLASSGAFADGNITDLDGLRVEYEHGWGLIRASNTTPNLVVRIEGDNAEAIDTLLSTFNTALQSVAPHLSIAQPTAKSTVSSDDLSPGLDSDFGGLSLDEDFGYKD